MILRRFYAENFRNIEKCNIEFSAGVNLLIGNNAQGKTNAVEGVNIFSRGKSFRGSDEKDLIRFGSEGFRIGIEYENKDGLSSLEYAVFGKERQRKKNGYKINKISEMMGSFRSVIFFPDNLRIIKDGPDERRNFINAAISQCFPEYIKYYSDFKNALENRNCILKFASKGFFIDENEITSWSYSMAEYASFIYVYRRDYIERIKKHAKEIMKEISDGKEELDISYISDIEDSPGKSREKIKEEYIEIMKRDLEREKSAGVSLFGPHRENIEIKINGVSARSYSSQGQIRSAVLSLKLAEGEVIKELFGEYPVFLFDDVLSELDEKRRKYIFEGVKDRQVIITACDEDKNDIKADKIINVSGGYYVSSRG